MDDSDSLLTWWQKERIKELDRLREIEKAGPLSVVENMVIKIIPSNRLEIR